MHVDSAHLGRTRVGQESELTYSQTAGHAIRSLVNLAQRPDGPRARVRQIAEQEDLPASYLAKIFRRLVRSGLLLSSRGSRGGFSLCLPPDQIPLIRVVEAVDGPFVVRRPQSGSAGSWDGLPMNSQRSDALRTVLAEYLKETTISDIVRALNNESRPTSRAAART